MELADLVHKIHTDLAVDADEAIEEDTELLMSGLVDSLGIMSLVTWIETQLHTEIDPGDVVIENFESPAAIMQFCASLTTAQPG